MADEKKPFCTPEAMSRIIQNWFANSRRPQIFLTDQGETSDLPGIGFSLTEFMDMLRKFDGLSQQPPT
jgi:hypothetical protein